MDRSEHTRRSLSEKETAVGEKDRQVAELQRQVAELQAKVGGSVGSVGSPPVVPADNRAGAWPLNGEPIRCIAPADLAGEDSTGMHCESAVCPHVRKQDKGCW